LHTAFLIIIGLRSQSHHIKFNVMLCIHLDISFNYFWNFNPKIISLINLSFTNRSFKSSIKLPYFTSIFYVTKIVALSVSVVFSSSLSQISHFFILILKIFILHVIRDEIIKVLCVMLEIFKKRVFLNFWIFTDIVAQSMKKCN
jgi:hypothetical protein